MQVKDVNTIRSASGVLVPELAGHNYHIGSPRWAPMWFPAGNDGRVMQEPEAVLKAFLLAGDWLGVPHSPAPGTSPNMSAVFPVCNALTKI